MAAYKAIKPEAWVVTLLAYGELTGVSLPVEETNGTVNDGKMIALLLTPLAVTKDNVVAGAF